ncbi:MAG TPA: FAD-linked oxidase C-terminal domain-containing protein [Solirubrobacteraceae bacterium]|nr:FAD-linked oxidase C-terminal domain-containing protein [Solirubrobacteraceae bacterium]
MSVAKDLRRVLGDNAVLAGDAQAARRYLHDETETRAISGRADAVALPQNAEQVAAAVAWCYQHDVPMIPRGGGTGFAAGAVPGEAGVVISLERLGGAAQVEPEYWRAWVPAGAITADVRRRARENGLFYAPDPGSAESSMIGGNIATNAGGPHTFKYGVTGTWVTGLEVVLAPGELVRIGGVARKDVAGYDLKSLLVGSEGTLGIVTGAWLKLLPAPAHAYPVAGFYRDAATGAAALESVMTCGIVPAAIEFLDAGALRASIGALVGSAEGLPHDVATRTGFMLLAEADGGSAEAINGRREIELAMEDGAVAVHAPIRAEEIAALWRWRDGVSGAVTSQRGGKLSEDIVVPVERLEDAVMLTVEIGERYGLDACSWGHAGDGNIHATFMIDRTDAAQVGRAEYAAQELFKFAAEVGGAISGEHGVGLVKNKQLALQWPDPALALHEGIKRLLDPKNLLNPGKKLAR